MKTRNIIQSILFPVLLCLSHPTQAQITTDDYDDIFQDKKFAITFKASAEYNYWLPNESYFLDYETQGLALMRYDFNLTHGIKFLPELRFSWETSMTGEDNRELYLAHKRADGLKGIYNKINLIAGIGNRLVSLAENRFDFYSPWRSNSNVEFSYSRETFSVNVSPTVSGLIYHDYNGHTSNFYQDEELCMYTKFEELQLNFDTKGFIILPAIFQLLFMPSGDIAGGESPLDTSLGIYYNTWQKPYSISQIITEGEILTGSYENIYAARFNAVGMAEKFGYYGDYFFFHNQLNIGGAWVNLNKYETLRESSSLAFFQFKIIPQIGFNIPIFTPRVTLSIFGSLDWGFMVGATFNENYSEETRETESILNMTSFINSDLLLKANMALTVII